MKSKLTRYLNHVGAALRDHSGVGAAHDQTFTVGLLHDLGKIALSNGSHDEYDRVLRRVYNDGVGFFVAECERFGFDHVEIGSAVAAKSKLASGLVPTIGPDPDPGALATLPSNQARLTELATVAAALCTGLGVARRAPVEVLEVDGLPAWSYPGLKSEDLAPAMELARTQHEHSAGLTAS